MMLMTSVVIVFVIVSRFLTVYPLLSLSGSGRRTSFITSLNLSQISEFSLVIASLGLAYGHIQEEVVSLILYSMAIASVFSSYFIKFNHQIYLLFNRAASRLGARTDLRGDDKEEKEDENTSHPIVLLGFHRGARALVDNISAKNSELLGKIIVVDFNLEVLKELKSMGIAGMFGDISSLDTLKHAHIENAEMILSTIPDMLLKGTNNYSLVKTCRALAPNATIVATADTKDQVEKLKIAGANEVLLPYSLAGEYLAGFLLKAGHELS